MHALSSTWLDTGTTGDICSMNGADLPGMLPDMLPRLWAFALRISGDRHDAEDLVQRACVRALERAHQLQSDTVPLHWMFSMTHRASRPGGIDEPMRVGSSGHDEDVPAVPLRNAGALQLLLPMR